MKKTFFQQDDLEKIKHAVEKVEKKTSGEVVTAFIRESSDYAVHELLFSVLIGLLYFTILSFFLPAVYDFISKMLWTDEKVMYYTVLFYGFSSFFVISFCYLLFNIPFFDRLIVSKKVMSKKVHERAVRHFFESGVRNTKDRTGILIFISFLERRVELLADSGISGKIENSRWQAIVDHIIKGIHSKQMTDYIVTAIEQCGDLLAEHFPIQANDVNELSDDIHILEK